MDWLRVPKEEARTIFPIGAILEDEKGIYKVLKFEKQAYLHKYQVEVITQKIPVPEHLKRFVGDKIQWLVITPTNLDAVKRIE